VIYLNQQELQKKIDNMEGIFKEIDNDNPDASLAILMSSLKLPDEEFEVVSKEILFNFEKSINNINDKLVMVQALNTAGLKAEDLTQNFEKMQEAFEQMKDLTQAKKDFLKQFMGIIINAISDTEGITKRIINVPIELCHADAKIPAYAKAGDAGMDVYAIEDTVINPGETVIVRTGLKCALPIGYELEVRPRSGISVKTPLRVANAPGTVDSGYRDEIGVIITNIEPKIKDINFDENGNPSIIYGQSYTITEGMRFAQLVLKEVPSCAFYKVAKVAEIGINRNGGFGSSGVN
jgi:dUTP pyrophosphatase